MMCRSLLFHRPCSHPACMGLPRLMHGACAGPRGEAARLSCVCPMALGLQAATPVGITLMQQMKSAVQVLDCQPHTMWHRLY